MAVYKEHSEIVPLDVTIVEAAVEVAGGWKPGDWLLPLDAPEVEAALRLAPQHYTTDIVLLRELNNTSAAGDRYRRYFRRLSRDRCVCPLRESERGSRSRSRSPQRSGSDLSPTSAAASSPAGSSVHSLTPTSWKTDW